MTAPRAKREAFPTRYSPEYEQRFTAPLATCYVAVESPKRNGHRALVHAVEAESFGDIARRLPHGVATLCGQALHGEWTLVPRQPTHGFLISCGVCRGQISVRARGGE